MPCTATLQHAIVTIDDSALQIGLVVGEDGVLNGTVTDGDIRRAILRNEGMDAPIIQGMNPN